MKRVGFHEIDFGIEVSIQLAQLTKQVALCTTKNTPKREACEVCCNFRHGVDT